MFINKLTFYSEVLLLKTVLLTDAMLQTLNTQDSRMLNLETPEPRNTVLRGRQLVEI